MDYKEKYENGLECIQEILSGAGDLIRISTLRNRLQPFFPELQENKDDRIRNGLIKAVSGMLKGNTLYGTDVTREEALAWLEKQGTPKDIDIMSGLKPSDLKPGTWIVHNTLGTCKIVCLNVTIFGSGYEVVSCNDGIKHFIGFDEESDSCSLSNCHLWTINDAKDGDVLAFNGYLTQYIIKHNYLDQFKDTFDKFIGNIVGMTKCLAKYIDGVVRGDEIKSYMSEHSEVENYVILDDDSDMCDYQLFNFVQTDPYEGITERDAKICVDILNGVEIVNPIRMNNELTFRWILADRYPEIENNIAELFKNYENKF